MAFQLKDSLTSTGTIIRALKEFPVNVNSIVLSMNTTNIQTVLLYGLWVTVMPYNKTSQNLPVSTIHVKIKTPDGLILYTGTLNLNQRYNLLTLLPMQFNATNINVQIPYYFINTSGQLLVVLTGNLIIVFENSSTYQTPPKPDNQTYTAIIEVSFVRDYTKTSRLLTSNYQTTTLNPLTPYYQTQLNR